MIVRFIQLLFLFGSIISLQAQTELSVRISRSYNIVDKVSGEKLFTTNYDQLRRYGGSGLFIAVRKGKYGLIDSDETVVLPFEYDYISFKSLVNRKMGLDIPYGIIEKDQHFGLLDTLGQLTTPIHFETVPGIHNEYGGTTKINGKYGFVSPSGEELIPFKYEKRISLYGEFAIVTENGKAGVHKSRGKLIIPAEYDGISKHLQESIFIVRKAHLYGVYKATGELILPLEYEDISLIWMLGNQPCLAVRKNKKTGLMDLEGELMTPIQYDVINYNHPKGVIVKKDGRYGLIGAKGETLIPPIYHHYGFASSGRFNNTAETWRTKERGYVKLEDGIQFDTTAYDDYYHFVPYYILLREGDKYRIADWYGQIKPGAYDQIDCNINTRKCFVVNNGQHGVIDYQGHILLPLRYGGFRYLGFDYKYIQYWDENYKLGVMNIDGIVILPAKYQYINYNEKSLLDPIYEDHLAFHVQIQDKWGLISSKEEWLIPPEYDHLGYFNNGLAPAKKKGLWGIIDKNNQEVVPFQYQDTRISKKGLIEVLIGQEWVLIEQKGSPTDKK